MKYTFFDNSLFKGKQNIPWLEVEKYLNRFQGYEITVSEYNDRVKIGHFFRKNMCGLHIQGS